MYVTQRYENIDGPEKRVPETAPYIWMKKIFCSLRLGFIYQILGLFLIIVGFVITGNGVVSYTLSTVSTQNPLSPVFLTSLAVGSALVFIGSIYFVSFQAFLSDDASWNRGYRSGSKFLGYGTVLELISNLLQFVLFMHLYKNNSVLTVSQYQSGGTQYLFTTFARFLHAVSQLFLAKGFFLIEAYYDEGSSQLFAIALLLLFSTSGVVEIIEIGSQTCTGIFCLVHFVTLCCGILWACSFERRSNSISPLLNECELTNEIEAQVEKLVQTQGEAASPLSTKATKGSPMRSKFNESTLAQPGTFKL